MSSTAFMVLLAMLQLEPWSGDAWMNDRLRSDILGPVAIAIDEVAQTDEDRAALAALAWHETKLARYVIEGRCKDGPVGARCDDGRARGPWQVWHWCKPAWDAPDGSRESLRAGARCALQMLEWGRHDCEIKGVEPGWLSAFAGYRSRRCDLLDAKERVATFRKILGSIQLKK